MLYKMSEMSDLCYFRKPRSSSPGLSDLIYADFHLQNSLRLLSLSMNEPFTLSSSGVNVLSQISVLTRKWIFWTHSQEGTTCIVKSMMYTIIHEDPDPTEVLHAQV